MCGAPTAGTRWTSRRCGSGDPGVAFAASIHRGDRGVRWGIGCYDSAVRSPSKFHTITGPETSMIRRIQALNFRCLRFVDIRLDRFHVLIRPNASGKSTLFDAIAFLGDLVRDGLEGAVRQGTGIFGIWSGTVPMRNTDLSLRSRWTCPRRCWGGCRRIRSSECSGMRSRFATMAKGRGSHRSARSSCRPRQARSRLARGPCFQIRPPHR